MASAVDLSKGESVASSVSEESGRSHRGSRSLLHRLFPCLHKRSETAQKEQRRSEIENYVVRADITRHYNECGSIHETAVQDDLLTPDELEGIRLLELAADESPPSSDVARRHLIYREALDHIDAEGYEPDWDYLRVHMPAAIADRVDPETVSLAKVKTMLKPKKVLTAPSEASDHESVGGQSGYGDDNISLSRSVSRKRRPNISQITGELSKSLTQILNVPESRAGCAGYPGGLTEQDLKAILDLRLLVNSRASEGDKTFHEIVRAYMDLEPEPYALCRFMRARKFKLDKVLTMLQAAATVWDEGRRLEFCPGFKEAIGAPLPVLRTQYPYIYSGVAKNGCLVSYFRAGSVSIEGVECVTSLDQMGKMAWHQMMHEFPSHIAKAQKSHDGVVRAEAMVVVDLKGLDSSALNGRTLEVMKKLIWVYSCFPEVLNSMIILNTPVFFSYSWRIIRSFVDPRTATKVTMFSDEAMGREFIQKCVEKDQILEDYGGSGPTFNEVVEEEMEGANRLVVKLCSISHGGEAEVSIELGEGEKVDLEVYTRSVLGADIHIREGGVTRKDVELLPTVPGQNDAVEPKCTNIASDIEGPGTFTVGVHSKEAERNGLNPHDCHQDHFLLVGNIN